MGFQPKKSLVRRKTSSSIEILCPAKINLYLNIVGKYPRGFHAIESIVNRISLCDVLTVTLADGPDFQMNCTDTSLANDNNLCLRAARLICRTCGLKQGFRLDLSKKIPVGAGLGGGSSCAASTLLAINELLNLNLSLKTLFDLGAVLGSDVNFFLSQSSFAFMWGRGEKIKPLDIETRLDYLIVYPGEILSTAKVYQASKPKLTKFINNVNIILHALKKNDRKLLAWNLYNALEKGAFQVSDCLKKHRSFFKTEGLAISGSGSAFFKLVSKKERRCALGVKVPGNWGVSLAHSI